MKNEEIKEFWDQRFSANGHNGFNDPVLYSIDQSERLEQLDNIIKKIPHATERIAIDFGCGDGDFTELLIKHGYKVYGVEISENALIHCRKRFGENFYGLSTDEFINISYSIQASIILSITALQHLVEHHDYTNVLMAFERHANKNATLVILEKVKGYSVKKNEKLITIVRPDKVLIDDFKRKNFHLSTYIDYNETFHILLRAALKLKSSLNWLKFSVGQVELTRKKHRMQNKQDQTLPQRILYSLSLALWLVKPVRPLLGRFQEHRIFVFQKK